MAKLNQIVAVVAGKKTRNEKEYGDLNKVIQKTDLFLGINRTYKPVDEAGETLPAETKKAQKTVAGIVAEVRPMLTGIMNAIATQEYGNCEAHADVKVDGAVIVPKVPVTVLLYLEKQLNDLHTFVGNLPTLDPSEQWHTDEQQGGYVTEAIQQHRTKKVQKALVLYAATKEHPAQTQLITDDVLAGYWTTVKSSTAMSVPDKQATLARIVKLQDAVKVAREEANSIEVQDREIASPILKYVFG